MKGKILVLLTMLLVSTNALATKARSVALGESKDDGADYFSDDRNIFRNVAFIHDYKDQVILEWGTAGNALGVDQTSTPKASGGVIKSWDNHVVGFFLGNEHDTPFFLRLAADDSANSLDKPDNTLVFSYGSETGSGVRWALGLAYSRTGDDESTAGAKIVDESKSMTLQLGANKDNWTSYFVLPLANESENNTVASNPKFEGKLGYLFGGSYDVSDKMTAFANYGANEWEQTLSTVKTDGEFQEYVLGVGYQHKMDNLTLFSKISYKNTEVDISYTAGSLEIENSKIPVVIGVEGKVASWLTLRGSISQNLYSKEDNQNIGSLASASSQAVFAAKFGSNGERIRANTTAVNVGASLHFKNLEIDGLVGTTDETAATTAGVVPNSSSFISNGVLSLDDLLTRVGMTYKF